MEVYNRTALAVLITPQSQTPEGLVPMLSKDTAPINTCEYRADGTVAVHLTQGKVAIIDAESLPIIAGHRWFAYQAGHSHTSYARSHCRTSSGRAGVLHMHRLINGAADGIRVDHIDNDGLNNRQSNLRPASNSQNIQNSGKRSSNQSGFKGVSWKALNRRWVAQIHVDGHKRHLGLFKDSEDAARVYDEAAREYFGEFARLNFPHEGERAA